jgi:hypothetical protein
MSGLTRVQFDAEQRRRLSRAAQSAILQMAQLLSAIQHIFTDNESQPFLDYEQFERLLEVNRSLRFRHDYLKQLIAKDPSKRLGLELDFVESTISRANKVLAAFDSKYSDLAKLNVA